jgi:membrane protein implicated in regulation of membrane protease activity
LIGATTDCVLGLIHVSSIFIAAIIIVLYWGSVLMSPLGNSMIAKQESSGAVIGTLACFAAVIGGRPVQRDGGRPGLLRRAERLTGERFEILVEVPGGGDLAE